MDWHTLLNTRLPVSMASTDSLLILLSIVIVLFSLYIFGNHKRNIKRNILPGPKALPIIGNLHNLLLKRKDMRSFLTEMSAKYGPVFSIQLGFKKTVVLSGYDAVADALKKTSEAFTERPTIPIIHKIHKGHGIIFSNGENWKMMRRFTISTLKNLGMGKKLMENMINNEVDLLIKELESYKGKSFKSGNIITFAVANIIVSILIGQRLDIKNPLHLEHVGKIEESFLLLANPMVLLYNAYPSLMSWIPGPHKTYIQNLTKVRNMIEKSIPEFKSELDMNEDKNLVNAFLVKQIEEVPGSQGFFHNGNLVTLVTGLYGAATQTTAITLQWCLLLMAKYPEHQRKVQEEIDRVIGAELPQEEDRNKLPYTEAVIHETLRYQSSDGAPYQTTQDITIKGYLIPKGTHVLPFLPSVLSDKNYFEKPEEFNPRNFLDSNGNFQQNKAFLVFSAGRRKCAGETIARTELFLFLTRLLQKFTFKPPPDQDTVDLTRLIGAIVRPHKTEICVVART
uniref:Cytochrome P450 n=1 Tax=Leptobrachium leishanense TaxID=445787 RepID=A0A8C5MSE6_9ANUR